MDFDKWLESQVVVDPEYVLGYNSDGSVVGVYPRGTPVDFETVEIDREAAELIFEGKDSILSYRVDPVSKKVIKTNKLQMWGIEKIDDVLHRIIDKKWSNIENYDVSISYQREAESLIFEMHEKYNGVNWEGETEIIFLVTEYNDPNELKYMISMRVGDISNEKVIKKIKLPKKFSIYTRRAFENYIFQEI